MVEHTLKKEAVMDLKVTVFKQVFVAPDHYAIFVAELVPLKKLAMIEELFFRYYHADVSRALNGGIITIPMPMFLEEVLVKDYEKTDATTLAEQIIFKKKETFHYKY